MSHRPAHHSQGLQNTFDCGSMCVFMKGFRQNFLLAIFSRIRRENPGWNIHGMEHFVSCETDHVIFCLGCFLSKDCWMFLEIAAPLSRFNQVTLLSPPPCMPCCTIHLWRTFCLVRMDITLLDCCQGLELPPHFISFLPRTLRKGPFFYYELTICMLQGSWHLASVPWLFMGQPSSQRSWPKDCPLILISQQPCWD